MFRPRRTLDQTEDWRSAVKLVARLAKTVVLFTLTVSLCLEVSAQSPLAVAHYATQHYGVGGIQTNLQFTLTAGPFYLDTFQFEPYSDSFQLATNDVGRMITIDATTDPNFDTLASILTNGEIAMIGFYFLVRPANGGLGEGISAPLQDAFAPLPPGNNGTDFQGFPISGVSFLIDTIALAWPGMSPSGNELWTEVAFAARVFVNGDPLLLSTNVSETAEVGDSISFSAFVASSAPLACQWFLNGSNSVGSATTYSVSGTNSLQITNAQLSDSGAYTLVVSNKFGSLTSAPMVLNVIPFVAQRPALAVSLTSQPGSLWTVVHSDTVGPTAQWTELAAATLTSSSQVYFDTATSLPPNRFYKAFQSNLPGVSSTLSLQTATAVTLTGNVGDTLRVDYINSIGPTNAWVTLGSVTLTNATQLYFDVSRTGQQARLYRMNVVP